MKKKHKKRIVGIISLVVVLVAVFIPVQQYCMRRVDHNQVRLAGFYAEEKNSLDMVVMGASETYYGYFADEAYKTAGITSYPYSFQYNPVSLWKYELKEILKRQKPKVLIVEVNGAGYGTGYDKEKLYSEAAIRILSDSMPMSKDKKKMIKELEHFRKDSEVSYYWPFLKFHTQWFYDGMRTDLKDLEKRGYSPLKGVFSKIRTKKHNKEMEIPKNIKPIEMNSKAEKSLKEFMVLCKKSGIKHVLFVRFPHKVTNARQLWRHKRYLKVGEVIKAGGCEYIDFSKRKKEIGLIWNKDFVDTEHLNVYGAKKLTNYIVKYVQKKYGLKRTKLSKANKKKWDTSVKYINAYYKYYDNYPKRHSKLRVNLKRFTDCSRMIDRLTRFIQKNNKKKT